jgi:hypothetical protein
VLVLYDAPSDVNPARPFCPGRTDISRTTVSSNHDWLHGIFLDQNPQFQLFISIRLSSRVGDLTTAIKARPDETIEC